MEYTITQAKKELNAIVSSQETTIILKNGKPEAVLIPFEQYRNMSKELIHLHEQVAIEMSKAIIKNTKDDLLVDAYKEGDY